MPVHEVAARGFGEGAERYEQSRPTYPADAIAHLASRLGIERGATVCDLAAGTGKLTRLLLKTGADVIAFEPVDGMYDVLRRGLPSVPTTAALAEAMPVRDRALHAVVVAQAFHWFDPTRSLDEIARVLRPGGGLGLVWNVWDFDVPWVERIGQIVASARATPEWRRGSRPNSWVPREIVDSGRFGAVELTTYRHAQVLGIEGVVSRVATTSHIVSAPSDERTHTLDAIRAALASDPSTRNAEALEFPYVVNVYTCERS